MSSARFGGQVGGHDSAALVLAVGFSHLAPFGNFAPDGSQWRWSSAREDREKVWGLNQTRSSNFKAKCRTPINGLPGFDRSASSPRETMRWRRLVAHE